MRRSEGSEALAGQVGIRLAASLAPLQRKQLQQWVVHIMRATVRSSQLARAVLAVPGGHTMSPRTAAARSPVRGLPVDGTTVYLEDEELSC